MKSVASVRIDLTSSETALSGWAATLTTAAKFAIGLTISRARATAFPFAAETATAAVLNSAHFLFVLFSSSPSPILIFTAAAAAASFSAAVFLPVSSTTRYNFALAECPHLSAHTHFVRPHRWPSAVSVNQPAVNSAADKLDDFPALLLLLKHFIAGQSLFSLF